MNTAQHRRLIIGIFLAVTLTGIFLPGILLHYTFETDLDTIQTVSKNQYNSPNSAMARNASAKLSEYEQIKLIAGTWDSETIPADSSHANITEVQAVSLARTAVEDLYQAGGYPYHFQSGYGNWYSWSTQCFQCTENTFHTYTAYCYLVTFYRYNSDECHNVLITENGTLLGICNNRPAECAKRLPYSLQYNIKNYVSAKYPSDSIPVTLLKITDSVTLPAYESLSAGDSPAGNASEVFVIVRGYSGNVSYDDILKMADSTIPENTEIYYFYHGQTSENYAITFIPWE
ncbi:MAG: hypothetical protein NC124_09300 [Clostridium sp.]|nr:hypothetical protein [Clostridium sp.]